MNEQQRNCVHDFTCGSQIAPGMFDTCGKCAVTREMYVAPYGRNVNGVPNRPNERVLIVVHCDNPDQAQAWKSYIDNQAPVLNALAIPHVMTDCLP